MNVSPTFFEITVSSPCRSLLHSFIEFNEFLLIPKKLLQASKDWNVKRLSKFDTEIETVLAATQLTVLVFSSLFSPSSSFFHLQPKVASCLIKLWGAPFMAGVFERNNELQIPGGDLIRCFLPPPTFTGSSGAEYYFEHAERFAKDDYLPTQEDIIRFV